MSYRSPDPDVLREREEKQLALQHEEEAFRRNLKSFRLRQGLRFQRLRSWTRDGSISKGPLISVLILAMCIFAVPGGCAGGAAWYSSDFFTGTRGDLAGGLNALFCMFVGGCLGVAVSVAGVLWLLRGRRLIVKPER